MPEADGTIQIATTMQIYIGTCKRTWVEKSWGAVDWNVFHKMSVCELRLCFLRNKKLLSFEGVLLINIPLSLSLDYYYQVYSIHDPNRWLDLRQWCLTHKWNNPCVIFQAAIILLSTNNTSIIFHIFLYYFIIYLKFIIIILLKYTTFKVFTIKMIVCTCNNVLCKCVEWK